MNRDGEPLCNEGIFRETLAAVLKEEMQPVVRLALLKEKVFLSDKEVEELYNIPAASLRAMRSRGYGPRYHQRNKNTRVLYAHSDIQDFLAATHTLG